MSNKLVLVSRPPQIVVHLMEVGRLGVKFGIEPPALIKLELNLEEPLAPPPKGASTLDEKVLHAFPIPCSLFNFASFPIPLFLFHFYHHHFIHF